MRIGFVQGAWSSVTRSSKLGTPMVTFRRRVLIGLLFGLVSTIISYLLLRSRGYGAGDFTWTLGGAEALLHGVNPYTNPAFGRGLPYPHGDPLFYPLPALFVSLPFTLVPSYVAGALFYGIGSGLLAFAVTRDGYARLILFLSAPYFVGAYVAQWSPLVTAAALLPWLLPIAFVKPNLGLAIGIGYPNIRAFFATALLFAVSLVVMPSWPWAWLANLKENRHVPPVLILPGIVLLIAAVAWRRQEGRLLLVMALVPQLLFFYDQLPLWLIPRTWKQSAALSVMSWVAYLSWKVTTAGTTNMGLVVAQAAIWVVAGIYLPAFALVLWQLRSSPSAELDNSPSHSVHLPPRYVVELARKLRVARGKLSRPAIRETSAK